MDTQGQRYLKVTVPKNSNAERRRNVKKHLDYASQDSVRDRSLSVAWFVGLALVWLFVALPISYFSLLTAGHYEGGASEIWVWDSRLQILCTLLYALTIPIILGSVLLYRRLTSPKTRKSWSS